MPYAFVVNQHNFPICLASQLFAVPSSLRAYNEIQPVTNGESLFIYVTKRKELFGLYKAISDVFVEQHPERGPWNTQKWDISKGFYPFRVRIGIVKPYKLGLGIREIEAMNIELNENKFKGMSVVFINDRQARALVSSLERRNTGRPLLDISVKGFESQIGQDLDPFGTTEKFDEMKLQTLVQKNISQLEEDLRVLAPYYNITEYLGYEGQIDILARDSAGRYVVIELKEGILPKDIWSQLFSYAWIVRTRIAEVIDVRTMAVCGDLGRETRFAFPELRRKLLDNNYLRVFKYGVDFNRKEISFEEVEV